MRADIADPEASFEFAKTAVAAGDLTGAVAALERILRINPTLANIQLEIGVLYLRLGDPRSAAGYIASSLASPEIPAWVRDRATNLLRIANERASNQQVSWSFSTAVRQDDNANAAPFDPNVRVLGLDGLLDESDTGREDTSVELAGSMNHQLHLDGQSGNYLDTNFGIYNRDYDQLSELDLQAINFDMGPRLHFGSVLNPSFSMRPYLFAVHLELDGDKYLATRGVGVNFRKLFSPALMMDVNVDYDDQDYFDTPTRVGSANRSGPQRTLGGRINYLPSPSASWNFGMFVSDRDANVVYEERDHSGLDVSYTRVLGQRRQDRRQPLSITIATTSQKLEYRAPDPLVDPLVAREDDRWSAAFTVNVPVAARWNVYVSVQHTDNESSLPNYQYDNTGAVAGLRAAF
jgi:hypothetical protein